MHREVEEEIQGERKRFFAEFKKIKVLIIILVVLIILIGIYSEYNQYRNKQFTKDLTYSAVYDHYYGEYKKCALKVISGFTLNPKSEIYAEVRMTDVYYPQTGGRYVVYLWIYQHHFGGFTYRLVYDGLAPMKDENGTVIGNHSVGGSMYVDTYMNLIEPGAYTLEQREEYQQFILDNEETIVQLIDAANKYWDLGLQYNPNF